MTRRCCVVRALTIWPSAVKQPGQGGSMPGDIFETEAWFSNLLAHGFERPPYQHWVWPLPAPPHGDAAHLHLMQQLPGGPLVALSNYYSCLYGPVGSAETVHNLPAAQWLAVAQA